MAYRQGLTDDFVAALNELNARPDGTWWAQMLHDPDLFVAIRNNYLNVYYRGCSLAKVSFENGEVIVQTHYKYLLRPRLKPEYVTARRGKFDLSASFPNGISDVLTTDLQFLTDLKLSAKIHAGDEKKFVAGIIATHDNIIDVEVALTHEDADSGATSAKRLDLVVLDSIGIEPLVRFYEVKLFANKEIHSHGEAKVVSQMQTYEVLLSRYSEDLQKGFKRSCLNILDLDGAPSARKRLAQHALDRIEMTSIDPKPYLIVGVFDDAQRQGSAWAKQRGKLEKALGEDHVILRGSAASVSLANGKRSSASAVEIA